MSETVVITGAFSYTGKYATRLLLERGYRVRTLTNHPPVFTPAENPHSGAAFLSNPATRMGQPPESGHSRHDPFGGRVEVAPYNFDQPEKLRRTLAGASALINTYWVRFPRGRSTFEGAVRNSRILMGAARDAGIQRIVHVSIANPSLKSQLGYYRGKAEVEQAVQESGLSYAILRPTVIFGAEDILVNNIAWFVQNFPVFAIPGDGRYGIRPIYVEDMARLLADAVEGRENRVLNAVGPETFTFEELVRLIARQVGRRGRVIHVPASAAYLATWFTGCVLGDVVLTWQEYKGLMENLLAPEGPAAGETRLSQWLAENGDRVGKRYASEVARHF